MRFKLIKREAAIFGRVITGFRYVKIKYKDNLILIDILIGSKYSC